MAIINDGRCRLVEGCKGELVDIVVGSEGVCSIVVIVEGFEEHGSAMPAVSWPSQVG